MPAERGERGAEEKEGNFRKQLRKGRDARAPSAGDGHVQTASREPATCASRHNRKSWLIAAMDFGCCNSDAGDNSALRPQRDPAAGRGCPQSHPRQEHPLPESSLARRSGLVPAPGTAPQAAASRGLRAPAPTPGQPAASPRRSPRRSTPAGSCQWPAPPPPGPPPSSPSSCPLPRAAEAEAGTAGTGPGRPPSPGNTHFRPASRTSPAAASSAGGCSPSPALLGRVTALRARGRAAGPAGPGRRSVPAPRPPPRAACPSRLTESQDHGMGQAGRDHIWSDLPAQAGSCHSAWHRVFSRRFLSIFSEEDSTASLSSLFQCSVTVL